MRKTMAQFVEMLMAINHTTFIGFNSITEPKMRKTGNRFFGLVEKCSQVNALVGYCYGQMVDNKQVKQLSDEVKNALISAGVSIDTIGAFNNDIENIVDYEHETFTSAGLKWGQYMTDENGNKSPVCIEHTNKQGVYNRYAQMAIMNTKKPVYRWKDSKAILTDDEKAEMQSFIPERKEGERQGLKKPYIIRAYTLSNIQSVRMGGQSFDLVA
jgi:hypothetical protein